MTPTRERAGRFLATVSVVFVLVVVLGFFASGWHRYTWGARFGTFGTALGILLVGAWWQRSHREQVVFSGPRWRTLVLWLAVPGCAAVWDILGLLTPPDRHHLTLSALELAYRPLHALVFALWMGIGWVLASTPLRRNHVSKAEEGS